jgi:hypothetical protein
VRQGRVEVVVAELEEFHSCRNEKREYPHYLAPAVRDCLLEIVD